MNIETLEMRPWSNAMATDPKWKRLTDEQAEHLEPLNRAERRKEARKMGLFGSKRKRV